MIPFNKLKRGKCALENSLKLKTSLNEVMPALLKSIGVIVELANDFASTQDDPLFHEVVNTIEEADLELDMRTQCNYALLLYSTARVSSLKSSFHIYLFVCRGVVLVLLRPSRGQNHPPAICGRSAIRRGRHHENLQY